MNKKGQSLVFCIILIPIIIVLFLFLADLLNVYFYKLKLYSLSRSIITNTIEDTNKNDIIMLYDNNDVDYENMTISYDNGVLIEFDSSVNSLYLDKKYTIHINIKGYKENDKIKFKKG